MEFTQQRVCGLQITDFRHNSANSAAEADNKVDVRAAGEAGQGGIPALCSAFNNEPTGRH